MEGTSYLVPSFRALEGGKRAMKEVARIGVSILGLYLIVRALSVLTGRVWYVRHVDISYLVRAFGPTAILFCGGVICLAFRDRMSSWILAGQKTDIP